MRKSGYDAAANICWHFRNKGDRSWRCGCPACLASYHQRISAIFGRRRSGTRWFWLACTYGKAEGDDKKASGFAATEAAAMDGAMSAVRGFRDGDNIPIYACVSHGMASHEFKKLNKAKRAARPPPDSTNSTAVEYLYSWAYGEDHSWPVRFRIVRRTGKRVFYSLAEEFLDELGEPTGAGLDRGDDIGFVDRMALERDGSVYGRAHRHRLHGSLQVMLADRYGRRIEPETLRSLKAAMAAAHPDKGGSHDAFIAARRAYEEARQRAKSQEERTMSAAG